MNKIGASGIGSAAGDMFAQLGSTFRKYEDDDFSEGQKKKVLIATSLCQKANLYIWDEPLNYIDLLSRIQIENMLKELKFHQVL